MLSFIWKKPQNVNVSEIERRLTALENGLKFVNDSISSKKSVFTNPKSPGSPYTIHAFAHQTIRTITINNVNIGSTKRRILIEPDPVIALNYKQPALIVILEVFDLTNQLVANNALLTTTYSNKVNEYEFVFNKAGDFRITMAVFWNRNK